MGFATTETLLVIMGYIEGRFGGQTDLGDVVFQAGRGWTEAGHERAFGKVGLKKPRKRSEKKRQHLRNTRRVTNDESIC